MFAHENRELIIAANPIASAVNLALSLLLLGLLRGPG